MLLYTQTEKDQYALIEQSAHLVLLKIGIYYHYTARNVASIIFREKVGKNKEQNAGIIGANCGKMHLVIIAMLKMKIEQYRKVKGIVTPLKCLFYVVTQIEKDRYTLIDQPVQYVLVKIGICNSIYL